MRSRIALALLVAIAAAAPALAAPPWRERYLAARRLCRDGEPAACRDTLVALRALLPGHPAIDYQAAAASARLGDRDGVLRWLGRFADRGLAADLGADTTFRELAGDSAFAALVRRLHANASPISRAELVHRFSDPDLIAEDVAWDERRGRWLVSSVHRRKIVAVDAKGRESDFAVWGRDLLWGVFGLAIDAGRDLVWVGTAAVAEASVVAETDLGRSALVCFDLATGAVRRRLELPRDGAEHVLGDLTLAADGAVIATDSRGGGVYRVGPDADTLETVVLPGEFASPQMVAISPDGDRWFVADYSRGIAVVDPASGSVRWLAQPADLAAAGIDGLYPWGNDLIAIQNGVRPARLLRITLSAERDRILSWRVLEQASPELGDPNHGTAAGGAFVFLGRSGWDRAGAQEMRAGGPEEAPVLLRLEP